MSVQWGYVVWLVNHLSPATPCPPLHVDPYKCTSHKLLWLLYDGKVIALYTQCVLSPANSALLRIMYVCAYIPSTDLLCLFHRPLPPPPCFLFPLSSDSLLSSLFPVSFLPTSPTSFRLSLLSQLLFPSLLPHPFLPPPLPPPPPLLPLPPPPLPPAPPSLSPPSCPSPSLLPLPPRDDSGSAAVQSAGRSVHAQRQGLQCPHETVQGECVGLYWTLSVPTMEDTLQEFWGNTHTPRGMKSWK